MTVARLPRTNSSPTVAATVERFLTLRDLQDRTVDTTYRQPLERFVGANAPAYYNRNRAATSSLFAWALKRRWVTHNPVETVERRKVRKSVDRTIVRAKLVQLWSEPEVALRERCLWSMLYETAARAEDILGLDIGDCDLTERCAVVVGKGGDEQEVFWATTTARLLDRYLHGRQAGPLFVTERRPTRPQPAADTAPDGRVRLSYRRAAELFTQHTGFTLHQLHHSALTHLAEAGVDVTLLKAKSRHTSLRSLEKYVSPSRDAVKKLTDDHDPVARRQR